MFARRTLPIVLAIISAPCAFAEDAEDTEALNQTAVRERLEMIPTIDGDLRREGAFTASAMPWPAGWGDLRLSYLNRAVAWRSDSPPAQAATNPPVGQNTLRERRGEVDLRWRQNLGTRWITFELIAHGVYEDRNPIGDQFHLGDIETNFVFPVYISRYQAVALVAGALNPLVDDGKDWLTSHGSIEDSGWTGKVEARGSFGIDLATLQVRVGTLYTPHGDNQIPGGAEPIKDTFMAAEGAVGATYRITRWLRFGAEQSFTERRWKSRDGAVSFRTRMISAPLLGSVEYTPDPGLGIYLQGYAGMDQSFRNQLDSRDRVLFGGSFMYVY